MLQEDAEQLSIRPIIYDLAHTDLASRPVLSKFHQMESVLLMSFLLLNGHEILIYVGMQGSGPLIPSGLESAVSHGRT